MKGEIYQACCIVASAKNALKSGCTYQPVMQKYVDSTTFTFINRDISFEKNISAFNETEWFDKCKAYGLIDIKLLIPSKSSALHLNGFINSVPVSIICFFENNKVTYFTPRWDFNNNKKSWNVVFTEYDWPDHPQGKPEFNDNITNFSDALLKIENLARKIKCKYFADVFRSSYNTLHTNSICNNSEQIKLPPDRMNCFEAAKQCDVFGAMGSWNDDPCGMAEEKGLSDEYEKYSSELYTQMTLATLYAINEW